MSERGLFSFQPESEKIIKSVDLFMAREGKGMLDVYLGTRILCDGPAHRGLFGRRRMYDRNLQYGAVISNGSQLIGCMTTIANEAYEKHKKKSPTCEAKPTINVTASSEGLETVALRF